MKKTYMQPAMLLTKVAMQQIICVSGPQLSGTTGDKDILLSRQRDSDWDDDEE